ncbi:hypothetical protein [Streptomyces sp. NPDC058629]|uniref:hypothetical protein n=1 Tax=Streptomyces sp. NPDC058629 TaxID=3346565 RepID=UPI00364B04A4
MLAPQYPSFALGEFLDRAGIAASIGSVGDAYGHALMESMTDLFETELLQPRRPWRTSPRSSWPPPNGVDRYCQRRLHGGIGHVPPVEHETDLLPGNPETPGHHHNLKSLPNPERSPAVRFRFGVGGEELSRK